jgi:hypothetical protein
MHLITVIARLWTLPMRLCLTARRSPHRFGPPEVAPHAGEYAVEFYLSSR